MSLRARSRAIAPWWATPRPRCCGWSAAISTAGPPGLPRPRTGRRRRSDRMSVRLDHGEDSLSEMHEINVTPFIDVMLVLLIIFMVAAPLATVDISINLPTVKADLTLALGDDPVERPALGPALDGITGGNHDTRIFLRADKTVPYGEVMAVMNLLRTAGYLKVALVGLAP